MQRPNEPTPIRRPLQLVNVASLFGGGDEHTDEDLDGHMYPVVWVVPVEEPARLLRLVK